MNYRHVFHAGNFADVFKHIILIATVKSLQRKENAFCYLDTHAGAGRYNLSLQKNKEYNLGVTKLFSEKKTPDLIHDYLSCIKTLNDPPTKLQFYPGSPYFVQQFLRPQDRMVLCELQDEEYSSLKDFFHHNKQVGVHHQDGYAGLKSFLPPKERRGLILIDPPYEKSDEFSIVLRQLKTAIQRFETGVYCVWYPIKLRQTIDRFHHQVQSAITQSALMVEFSIYPETLPTQLNGCGMLIVNPPWQLDQKLHSLLPWLLDKLNVQQGHHQIKYI